MNIGTHSDANLLKLLTWLSPNFPVGAYIYSHGIEFAVEEGLIRDAYTLQNWIEGVLTYGAGCKDGILFSEIWKAASEKNDVRLLELSEMAQAFQPTAEMEIESHAQGNAFIDAICAAWPSNQLNRISSYLKQDNKNIPYSVAVALVSAIHGIALVDALTAYLNAFSSNLVSAGVRLIPIGQTMGLKVLAGLADTILTVKEISLTSSPKNMGSATLVVDWTSARHETQYTRLFRS